MTPTAHRFAIVVALLIGGSLVGCKERLLPARFHEPQLAASPRPGIGSISDQEWSRLQSLSPATLPAPPKDVSNEVADDPKAAHFGQILFFETRFSGKLLESDNDGMHGGAGLQGETGKVSCATCHLPGSLFTDTRTNGKQLSLGSGWSMRRSPSILDSAQAKLLMWDGRFDSFQRQILAVYESPLEANSSRLFLAQQVARLYPARYSESFNSDPTVVLGSTYPTHSAETTGCQAGATEECDPAYRRGLPGAADYDAMSEGQKKQVTTIALNTGKAIAAYVRKLSCGQGRFDAFMHGDASALTPSEQRGAALFAGRGKCVTCHSGPYFSDQQFHNVGLFSSLVSGAFVRKDDPGAQKGLAQALADPLNTQGSYSSGDDGRLPASVGAEMLGAFRTPMLRCSSKRPSFMHTAQLTHLWQVIDHFNRGGDKQKGVPAHPAYGFLGETEISPLGLSDEEAADLTAFVGALDGPGPAAELLGPPSP